MLRIPFEMLEEHTRRNLYLYINNTIVSSLRAIPILPAEERLYRLKSLSIDFLFGLFFCVLSQRNYVGIGPSGLPTIKRASLSVAGPPQNGMASSDKQTSGLVKSEFKPDGRSL